MALRFLVVEGNPVGPRERHQATFGKTYSDSYGSVLQTIDPTSIYDVVFPADEGANLPDSGGLESYDGVFLTGSTLNAYHATVLEKLSPHLQGKDLDFLKQACAPL